MPDKDQLHLKFEKQENNLLRAMKDGQFVILFEIDTPPANCNIETVISRFSPFLKAVNSIEGFKSGLAINDCRYNSDGMDILDFASELCQDKRSCHMLFVSGRNKNRKHLNNIVKSCMANGFYNIVPVSGAVFKGETFKELEESQFCESAEVLCNLKEEVEYNNLANIGTVVNPFKYSQESIHTQYYKLIRKFNLGARFVVTQAGWDILKHQELRWYLETRNYFEPCFANMILLSPERIEKIVSGHHRGIFFSPDFLSSINKESRLSISQFWAAQWRRFQIYITGLRWMGYSGVIISGLDNEYYVNTAISRISSAFKDIKNYESWREVYLNFLSRNEMAPYPYKYYIYKNLLEESYFDKAEPSSKEIKKCSKREKFVYNLSKIKNKLMPSSNNSQKEKKLASSFYLSSRSCPKGMVHGSCGETNHDNSCCLNASKECLYSKIFRLAAWQKNFEPFE